MPNQEDRLWEWIGRETAVFSDLSSHNSDAFDLLALLLAYYQARGNSPEEMIGPTMKERIAHLLASTKDETDSGGVQ